MTELNMAAPQQNTLQTAKSTRKNDKQMKMIKSPWMELKRTPTDKKVDANLI
jgi:hypothetical protein